jgi:hypothetical protein
MSTQNVSVERYTFLNLSPGAPTSYYYPSATGTTGDGYDHITVRATLVSADVNNTLTLTVESDDGVTGTFAWPETRGMYDWMTGAYGAASFVANNATVRCRLLAINHNARLWRVKIVCLLAAAAANSGIIEIRKVKV